MNIRKYAPAVGIAAVMSILMITAVVGTGGSTDSVDDVPEELMQYSYGTEPVKSGETAADVSDKGAGADEELESAFINSFRAAAQDDGDNETLSVTVSADGRSENVLLSGSGTVYDALAAAGVELGYYDVLNVDETGKVEDGAEIVVQRVEYSVGTEVRSIDYDTIYREDSSIPKGESEVLVNGREGEALVEVRMKLVDGTPKAYEIVSREITVPAIDRVILTGTGTLEVEGYSAAGAEDAADEREGTVTAGMAATNTSMADTNAEDVEPVGSVQTEENSEAVESLEAETDKDDSDIPQDISLDEEYDEYNTGYESDTANDVESISLLEVPDDLVLDENGIPLNYTRTVSGKSCAYTAEPDALTSTGKTVFQGYAAVDPDIIPYGTELYIVADDGEVYGYAIAADTGYSVRAGDIVVDLFMNEYDDCIEWGAKNVTMYVLD